MNESRLSSLKGLNFGKLKNPLDRKAFHPTSLVVFLAWVGLGADGLNSSPYGPAEPCLALGQRQLLPLPVALMMALTRLLHHHTLFALQQKLQFTGLDIMILLIPWLGMREESRRCAACSQRSASGDSSLSELGARLTPQFAPQFALTASG